ncbi:MAG: phospholipid carrier-dependent glycosyltransferase [Actinomycetota bacterium]|nr:phospholipid carrier-dependent glycosyltransferase [Actinomycetota bacterium]
MSTAIVPGPTGSAEARAAGSRRQSTPPAGGLPRDEPWGWVAAIGVALVAGVLRFWQLGNPGSLVFDETYYATEAQDLLRWGVEYDPKLAKPDFVVHPPVGKWVIGAGEALFGNDAFGWRFSVALLGTLSVLMLARIARRMLGSTLLGTLAGLLLALDGLHFVTTRTALLDPVLMFWVLAAFGCLVLDRDRTRSTLAALARDQWRDRQLGPLLFRPWRVAAGACLGLAVGTKWSALWFVAAFGLLTVLWDLSARRSAGVPRPLTGTSVLDVVPAFVSIVGVAFVVYVASWTGWLLSDAQHAWARGWAAANPQASWPLVPDALRSLAHYHSEMWTFHRDLRKFHPYKSHPWSWLVVGRPVSFFYEAPTQGQQGCQAAQCSRAITAIGNPVVWWAALLALPACIALWLGRRDWRAGAALAGVAAGYLPWFAFAERPIFYFYAVVFTPFLVLAVTLCLGLVLGPADASPRRRKAGAFAVGAYTLLVVATFAWLYPVLSGQVVPYDEWYSRMLFPSWI